MPRAGVPGVVRERGGPVGGPLGRELGPGRGVPAPAMGRNVSEIASRMHEMKIEPAVGVKPSILTSQNTVSTGSKDLDRILGHQGIPVGTSLLIKETSTTDFNQILLKLFASQGVQHSRLGAPVETIVVGPSQFGSELYGLYQSKSSKEVKKRRVSENESKVSVQNVINSDLKIAWRYGLNSSGGAGASEHPETDDEYCQQFDITCRLTPAASSKELSCVGLEGGFEMVIKRVEQQMKLRLKTSSNKVFRIVVPAFLDPSVYPLEFFQVSKILMFVHSLRSLLRKYSRHAVVAIGLNVELLGSELLVASLNSLCDSVVQLEPFGPEMVALLERTYKSQPTKIQHGLLQVHKVAVMSERGEMRYAKDEFGFRNGQKRFAIEPWGIPVEDSEADGAADSAGGTANAQSHAAPCGANSF